MACGAAVVSTPVPSVVELAGDGVATFRPGDVTGLTGTVVDLLGDDTRRSDLARRGSQSVKALSWEITARGTAEAYRSLGLSV